MRVKLLKKMYRQTNESIKRGDIFQQRPCPFYHEMHRIFSGNEENNTSGLNSESLNNDDEQDEEYPEEENINIESDQKILSLPTEEKFVQIIDRFIQYQQQTEVRYSSQCIHLSPSHTLGSLVQIR